MLFEPSVQTVALFAAGIVFGAVFVLVVLIGLSRAFPWVGRPGAGE